MSNRPSQSGSGGQRRAASTPTPPAASSRRTLVVLGGLAVVVVAVGLVIALAGGGDDETATTATTGTTASGTGGPCGDSTASGEPDAVTTAGSGDDTAAAAGSGDGEPLVYGTVTVAGAPLPQLEDPEDDPAVCQAAPVLTGQALDGSPVTVGGAGEPTLIAFLAHWCPHCQAELPLLVALGEEGELEGIRTVAVLTGTDDSAPNFPPSAWLDTEGWTGDVLVDDESSTAAFAYGLAGYPLLVFVDGDGNVVARTSGEQPAEVITALVDRIRA